MEIKIIVQKRLNEDVIDYDLLEDLVCHVDETCDEGAILVFLPVSPSDSLFAFFLGMFASPIIIILFFLYLNNA